MKTKPLDHQRRVYDAHRDDTAHALFWEPGCGKTKTAIDMACFLSLEEKINGLFVLAPGGVTDLWVLDELPKHGWDEVSCRAHLWSSKRAQNVGAKRDFAAMLKHDGLAVLAMTYDALNTVRGKAAAKQFLTEWRCLFVADESTRVKTPRAKRTKLTIAAAKLAPYTRILTGTPVTQSPFDLYSQLRVLDADFWKDRRFGSYYAFKSHFGVFERKQYGAHAKAFDQLVEYRRLDELNAILDEVSSRVTKADALDLPPKTYTRRYFELSPVQSRVYEQLRDELVVELSGGTITAALAITRLMRLQQISCGFIQDGEDVYPIDGPNPRLDALLSVVSDLPSAIIWARFRYDVDVICNALNEAGHSWVRYDGAVGEDDRRVAVERFQAREIDFLVANPAAAGMGLTLHATSNAVYYNNNFSLEQRLQSEDRCHRVGQHYPVTYTDLICHDTIDAKILEALRSRRSVADLIMGDDAREWL